MAAEVFDDVDALGYGGAEVGGAGDEIALIQVVGADAAHEKFVDECFLDFGGVVDAAKEDGLVAQRDAGFSKADEAVADFGGEFFGMVGVDGDEERVMFFKHFA